MRVILTNLTLTNLCISSYRRLEPSNLGNSIYFKEKSKGCSPSGVEDVIVRCSHDFSKFCYLHFCYEIQIEDIAFGEDSTGHSYSDAGELLLKWSCNSGKYLSAVWSTVHSTQVLLTSLLHGHVTLTNVIASGYGWATITGF